MEKLSIIFFIILIGVLVLSLVGCQVQKSQDQPGTTAVPGSDTPTASTEGEDEMPKAILSFHSFDGGGPDFTAVAQDASIISWQKTKDYGREDHNEIDGAAFTVTFTFTGLKPGKTELIIEERSPIAGNTDLVYAVTVGEDLSVTLEQTEARNLDEPAFEPVPTLIIQVGDRSFCAALEDNSSAEAFIEEFSHGEITVEMHDYGNFEKVGPLPFELPRNDETITTEPGDIILYQGNQITIYYDENTWNFTRLAKIDNVTREELLDVLGSGDVTVTFWIEWSE